MEELLQYYGGLDNACEFVTVQRVPTTAARPVWKKERLTSVTSSQFYLREWNRTELISVKLKLYDTTLPVLSYHCMGSLNQHERQQPERNKKNRCIKQKQYLCAFLVSISYTGFKLTCSVQLFKKNLPKNHSSLFSVPCFVSDCSYCCAKS